ncbi:MAG: flavin-dependent dehydrogenase [Prochlorothrix sp.]|nr:flavin-dependent dehydrogenase [Prochlorothrix sp.]
MYLGKVSFSCLVPIACPMRQLLYLEAPTPDTDRVCRWLQDSFSLPEGASKRNTPDGISIQWPGKAAEGAELAVFMWSVQRTTYVKVFRWGDRPFPKEGKILHTLKQQLLDAFPPTYPAPPDVDLSQTSIFDALAEQYPRTVKYFREIPNGEADLTRAYWWEQRWRDGVNHPQQPKQVVFQAAGSTPSPSSPEVDYDLIYVGGALGVIHAAMMAKLGYRVLLVERLGFGRMNREWNISRDEIQSLLDLGLLSPEEVESVVAREYVDGFHKFFDANNPPQAKAEILHTPTVLNVAVESDRLLQICGQKLQEAGGDIWDYTEFERAEIYSDRVLLKAHHRPRPGQDSLAPSPGSPDEAQNSDPSSPHPYHRRATGRLLIDAMGTASPIAWQMNQGRPFDSVCPTVGAVFQGLDRSVWDTQYGDVLNSHGDVSRGRQLIWELFPAGGDDLTVYLFHYHQVHPDNPGSLLEMYEDFFTILPEYRRCDLDQLTWKKATFGYIPGYFNVGSGDRRVAFDRVMAIGDAASLQSPLIFTGFGSLVRNLPRLTTLLDAALQRDLLAAKHLEQVRAYQSNIAVTWLFSKGMMVPTGRVIRPERINAMLNTFFGILASESPSVSDAFMKDRADWVTFNRMALTAARQNPSLLAWIWDLAGPRDMLRWVLNYVVFSILSLVSLLLSNWLPAFVQRLKPWMEPLLPGFWFWLLAQSYLLTDGVGRAQWRKDDRPSQPPPPNVPPVQATS